MEKTLEQRISMRPVSIPDDERFLQHLYFSSRGDLHGLFADEHQMRQLLLMQYKAQATSYSRQFPSAEHDIIMLDEDPIGRLIIDRDAKAARLIDITLLPESRNLGIGTLILTRFSELFASLELEFELSVQRTNPARQLYERLGFKLVGEDETRLRMRWSN
ncbi:MAG: GNAT family N-acetyltransferase [Acidobacteria bacterium]|nr:MAG: GNAT family N-acetyltransferase [Acidobacteriota bacterium]